jgi:glycosyltransferase involved in cell wall biosynthesis
MKYGVEFGLIRNMAILKDSLPELELPEGFPRNDFLAYLGAVNQGRGLEEILHVLADRDEHMVIIGSGDKMDAIRKLILELKLENRVHLCGKVLPEEVPGILRQARAGLNLLREEGLSYRYSLANKFFDYVHAGIPQVCIDFPEYTQLMSEFRVGLTCSLDASAIHAALNQISQSQEQDAMKSEITKARLVWNWQEEEKTLLRLYKNLFENNPQSHERTKV